MVELETAVKETGASTEHIERLIELGLIQAAQNLERQIIPLERLRRLESILEGVDLSELEGKTIHLAEASRDYDIPVSSLSRWYRSGYIRKMGKDRNRVLLNEADVAFIKLVIESQDLKPGQSLGYVLRNL
jgi:hypothetical protein